MNGVYQNQMIHSVTFFPKNVTVEVEENTTIMEAALMAGVPINSLCGGEGACGSCKVIVEGMVAAPPTNFIHKTEWEKGHRLACQSRIVSDLMVFVPQEAAVSEHKILSAFEAARLEEISPLVTSRYLVLPAPSLDDNLGDLERLERGLGVNPGELRVSLDLLKLLPVSLRDGDWKITAVIDEESRLVNLLKGDQSSKTYGLAVDIGTTTVVVALIDLFTGEIVAQASDYNKQIVCGEDVLSRIAFTEECELARPHQLILDTLKDLISSVAEETPECMHSDNHVCASEIGCMTVTGNTTMMHLFMGLPPKTIRYEPYISIVNVPPIQRASDLGIGICPDAPVFFMPGRASYVGGDIVADVLASEMYNKEEISLLIDVGTNGELVLGSKDWMVTCSCSAGPAFEGGEVLFGMRAMAGAIDSLKIGDDLEVRYTTINDVRPKGICGSGLIDLLAEMLVSGLLDKKGRILERKTPRIRDTDEGKEFVVAWADETAFAKDSTLHSMVRKKDIIISDNDIQNVIRTKGAVYAGCSVLLKSVNMTFDQVDRVYVAGAFGNYLDIGKAQLIGLLPDLPKERFVLIGNGALAGARLALLSRKKREDVMRIYEMMTYFELSTTQMFFDEFSSALFLPHTDIDQFPRVREVLGTAGR